VEEPVQQLHLNNPLKDYANPFFDTPTLAAGVDHRAHPGLPFLRPAFLRLEGMRAHRIDLHFDACIQFIEKVHHAIDG